MKNCVSKTNILVLKILFIEIFNELNLHKIRLKYDKSTIYETKELNKTGMKCQILIDLI